MKMLKSDINVYQAPTLVILAKKKGSNIGITKDFTVIQCMEKDSKKRKAPIVVILDIEGSIPIRFLEDGFNKVR